MYWCDLGKTWNEKLNVKRDNPNVITGLANPAKITQTFTFCLRKYVLNQNVPRSLINFALDSLIKITLSYNFQNV